MKGTVVSEQLEGRRCAVWAPEGRGPFPAVYLCGGDLSENLAAMGEAAPAPFILVSSSAEWEKDYTPWPAPAPGGSPAFAGGAQAYLHFLEHTLKPWADGRFPVLRGPEGTALLGYSLGGLFTLWAFLQSDLFGFCGSLSGSLWYPGWDGYLKAQPPKPGARVYLSLGKTEEHTRNPMMRAVGDCTRQTAAVLEAALGPGRVTLEWNRGGHFTGVPGRWNKALQWVAKQMNEGRERYGTDH